MLLPIYIIRINQDLKRLELYNIKDNVLLAVSKKISIKDGNMVRYQSIKKTYRKRKQWFFKKKKSVKLHPADEKVKENELYSVPYINDIMNNLLKSESIYLPQSKKLKIIQDDRQRLLSWLINVQIKCKMHSSSFHYAVNILDRFLSLKYIPANIESSFNKTPKSCLQLIGCASMWLSAKYNEVDVPDALDFIYMCDSDFTAKDMKKMEEEIINTLEFNFSIPTSYHFAKRYIHIMQHYMPTEKIKIRLNHLVKYYIEFAIFAPELFGEKYSLIAAGSTLAASYWLDVNFEWKEEMSQAIGYKRSELNWVMKVLKRLIYDKPKKIFSPLIKKYEKPEKGRVALMRYKSERPI